MAFYDSTSIKKVLTDLKTWLTTNLGNKVDKHGTDRLMTSTEATKLSGIETGAQVNVKPDWNAASNTPAEILNKPTIPAAQVNADWNAVSGAAAILNKPTIPTTTWTFIDYVTTANTSYGTAEKEITGKLPDTYTEFFLIFGQAKSSDPSTMYYNTISTAYVPKSILETSVDSNYDFQIIGGLYDSTQYSSYPHGEIQKTSNGKKYIRATEGIASSGSTSSQTLRLYAR